MFRRRYVFRSHYTDEQLLSLLDEQPDARLIVSSHLQSCWKCRSRLIDIEDQFRTLTGAWSQAKLHPPTDTEEARNRFLAWANSGSFQFQSPKPGLFRFTALLRAPVMAGVCAILVLGGVTVWELQQHDNPAPLARPIVTSVPLRIDRLSPKIKAVARVEHPVVPVELPRPSTRLVESRHLDVEVEAWWALHRAGACNGEPIEIHPTDDGKILVSGIVPTRRRRRELTAALEKNSESEFVRIELETAEELPVVRNGASLARATTPVQRSGPPAAPSEFQIAAAALLRRMYPTDTAIQIRTRLVEIGNRAIRRSEDSAAEAMAIRRLGTRFRNDAATDLSAQSRQLLEVMAREHLLALRSHLAELDGLLAPILSSEAPEPGGAVLGLDLTAAIEQLRILIQGSLSGNSSSLGSPAKVSREIAGLSAHLTAELSDVDSAIARVFLKQPR